MFQSQHNSVPVTTQQPISVTTTPTAGHDINQVVAVVVAAYSVISVLQYTTT